MIRLLEFLKPPASWIVPVSIVVSVITGILIYLFYVSRAASYLSDKPEICVNCHIMAPQYATWSHSSHREAAVCNDCHVPHNTQLNKYYFKAKDGMRHSTIFTMRAEPQVIFIKEAGQKVVKENCIRCHTALLADNKMAAINSGFSTMRKDRPCWECHREVPHGRVNSLSSVPYARVPLPESPVPEWINTGTRDEGQGTKKESGTKIQDIRFKNQR
jgi:cytochrome c nitrite reductase small subunit